MATEYSPLSPWYTTTINKNYLDIWQSRAIPAYDDDAEYVIETQYKHRPDLLAFDA